MLPHHALIVYREIAVPPKCVSTAMIKADYLIDMLLCAYTLGVSAVHHICTNGKCISVPCTCCRIQSAVQEAADTLISTLTMTAAALPWEQLRMPLVVMVTLYENSNCLIIQGHHINICVTTVMTE